MQFYKDWRIRKNDLMLTEEEQAVELTEAVLGQELSFIYGANTTVGIYDFVVAYIGTVANFRLG